VNVLAQAVCGVAVCAVMHVMRKQRWRVHNVKIKYLLGGIIELTGTQVDGWAGLVCISNLIKVTCYYLHVVRVLVMEAWVP
jgi:hypothetical protein